MNLSPRCCLGEVAISQFGSASPRISQSAAVPLHWPSAVLGLLLAIVLVTGVAGLASMRRHGDRGQPRVAATEAVDGLAQPTPIAMPTPQASLAAAPEQVKVANTRGAGVNLRATPGERAPRMKTIPEGTSLVVVGPDQAVDGVAWRNVRDASGAVGWVAASFTIPS